MSTYHVNWILTEQEASAVENSANASCCDRNVVNRYCANCGKVVPFADSGKVRRNANGKNIHVFAIYKCPKDHTWNKRITEDPLTAAAEVQAERERELWCGRERGSWNSCPGDHPGADSQTASQPQPLSVNNLRVAGFSTIAIKILAAPAGMRLDQVLAQYLREISRSEWQRRIKEGSVLVNGNIVKVSFALRESVEVSIAIS